MCGAENEVNQIGSYSTHGCLIDSRPMFLGIDPLPYMIQRCDICGYSGFDLSSTEGVDTSVVTRDWLSSLELVGDTALGYQTHAAIMEASGDPDAAGSSYLRAAWMFDDECDRKNATEMRTRASELLRFSDSPDLLLICADLLRVIGDREGALEQLDVLSSDPLGLELAGMASFERRLIESGERSHSIMANSDDVEDGRSLHRMRLTPEAFSRTRDGSKRFEMRLDDEKHRDVKVGDIIEFTDTDTSGKVYVSVREVRRYDGFADLYADIDPSELGYRPGEKADPSDMDRIYPADRQRGSKVLAIGIDPVPPRRRRGDPADRHE